ncbi:MAG: glycosyltransferase [Pyrinomonadaceae bacterium]
MSKDLQTSADISLLVCTYNRREDLRELLMTAIAQETGGAFAYEIIVVDNNSSDDTRRVVEEFIAGGHRNIRYLFEGRQGKSHALNTGLSAARGWIYTICDDDFILPKNWLKDIFEAFRVHTEVSFVSGKVLPLWQSAAPAWLTQKHWSPIAMADYGEEAFYADEDNQICLLACSFRLADVKTVGGYHSELGVSKGKIGGTEDAEILQRLWKSGRKGIYLPHIAFYHKVTPDRLTKSYHRRWHRGHGRFYALMREEEFERASARLFDVPAHLYKQAMRDARGWLANSLRGKPELAFQHETQLCFFKGFFQQRRADYSAAGKHGIVRELVSFARALAGGKTRHGARAQIN